MTTPEEKTTEPAQRPLFFLACAWLFAVISTAGSLYYSEIKGFIPCTLCWYQRILMYPLVLLLGIALLRHEKKETITPYFLPVSLLGTCLSLYHYSIQKFPLLNDVTPCSQGVPCSVEYVNYLGFITIPFLAFLGFTSISISLFFVRFFSK